MKEGRKMTRSAGVVGLFTLASRVLGLIRDSVVAALFPKAATDPFYVAFTIPNVLRQLLAEGALTGSFIPVFTVHRDRDGEQEARTMLRGMLGVTLLVLLTVALLGALGASWVVPLFAYGFHKEPEMFGLAVLLTRVMFAFIVAVGLTALAAGVLNTLRHFVAPALAPVTLNFVIITVVLAGRGVFARLGLPPILALAVGVVAGGFGQLALQLPFLRRHGMLVAPRLGGFGHPGVRRVGRLMLPAVFGLAVYQLNIILSRQFASFLPVGAVSALYYSQRLIEFPMGIFAVAVATVSTPNLSSQAAAGDLDGLKATYRFALGLVLFIMLPATAGLLALSLPLIAVIFQRGRFDHQLAAQTALTLQGFLCGMWAGAGARQTVPVFYAMQDTRTPVKVACLTVVVYAGAALATYRRLGTFGLALAVSLSSVTNFGTLAWLLRRRLGRLGLRGLLSSVARSVVAATVAGAIAYGTAFLGNWQRGGAAGKNYGVLMAAVLGGLVAYLVTARLLRIPELGELAAAFRRRRSTPPASAGDPT